jgi:putative membrane protein
MMYGYDHGAWMVGGWLLMLLIWLVPIILIVVLVKYLVGGPRPGGTGKTALDILEEAYARGEISREEFLQKREDLRKK